MRDTLTELMAAAQSRFEYADARFVAARTERVSTRNQDVEALESSVREGVGVRVRADGAWGFAATQSTSRSSLEYALDQAARLAQAAPRVGAKPLTEEPRASGDCDLTSGTDPFAVPVDKKLSLLAACDEAMRAERFVETARSQFLAFSERKVFASTEGSAYEQTIAGCGGGIMALASDGSDYQIRSYPASFRGDVAQAGFEHFLSLELEKNAPRVATEAAALLTAPQCPRTKTTVILGGEQLALQLHESVGHALELDRVLGTEASYAGKSFVDPAGLGGFRYGSEHMSVTADATVARGLGSFSYDDEGVAARRTALISNGVLRGFLSSRETAAQIGLGRSAGCMRASGFDRQPVVRMTNVNLEPGDAGSLDDLIAATDHGIYMETNRSWSIDSLRLGFQFATELAYEITAGKLGRMLKNPSYGSVTPQFWQALDAVCSSSEWRLWPVLNCGKAEPGQSMRVSHGTAPARFTDIEVGVA